MDRPSPSIGDSDIHPPPSPRDPLTDHFPQPAIAVTNSPLSSSQIDLSYPVLDNDGSIPDLTELTSHQSHHHPSSFTPPAALSTLGARARMDHHETASESGASLADSQYDMLDDMSEISTDDHDTASIASYEDHPGQLTPEQAASDSEAEEDMLENMPLSSAVATESKSSESTTNLQQTKAENDLIDSYMSDDLETPRQSTVVPSAPKKQAKHILFCSDSSTPLSTRDLICGRIASSIEPSKFDHSTDAHIVRLPATPTGVCRPPAVIDGKNDVVATIQYCVGAKETRGGYKLQTMDSDEKHTSFFTIGNDGKSDLQEPHIAVIYLNDSTHDQQWLTTAYEAMNSLGVPIILIRAPNCQKSDLFASYQTYEDHPLIDADKFANMDRKQLHGIVSALLQPSTASRVKSKSSKTRQSAEVKGFSLLAQMAMISVLLVACLAPLTKDPSRQVVARRETLATVLEQVTASTNATKDYNIEHLLPLPSANCRGDVFTELLPINPSCEPSSRFLVDSANSFIISAQPVPGAFQTASTQVSRSDGQQLSFNQTKLINGVYQVTFDEGEAYGVITVSMLIKQPYNNITAVHNFGRRMLHRKTYERATTDVSKVVSKDVAVIRHAASTFSGKVQSEFGAGLSATKNVTSQLALSMARELQVVAQKAAHAGNNTVSAITKELVTMRNDLVQLPQDVKKKAKNTTRYLMRCTGARIALARDNLELIKAGLRRHYGKKTLPAPKPKTSMLPDIFTSVKGAGKGAGDQLRRDIDRAKNFWAPKEDAEAKTLRESLRKAELEVAKTGEQYVKAYKLLTEHVMASMTTGHKDERKKLEKEMKEAQRAMAKAQQEYRRLASPT